MDENDANSQDDQIKLSAALCKLLVSCVHWRSVASEKGTSQCKRNSPVMFVVDEGFQHSVCQLENDTEYGPYLGIINAPLQI